METLVSVVPGKSASDSDGGDETVYSHDPSEIPVLGYGFKSITGRRQANEDRLVAITKLNG